MGYVYRYIDKKDNIIKYVGIVWGETRTLERRLQEHTKDNWFSSSEWRIEYICEDIDTRSEAESFESHYISLYKTDQYYNIAKSGWGINKYLPNRERDFVLYKPEEHISQKMRKEIAMLTAEKEKLENEINNLHFSKDRISAQIDKLKETLCETEYAICNSKNVSISIKEIFDALDKQAAIYDELTYGISTKSKIEKWKYLYSGVLRAKDCIEELMLKHNIIA